MCCEVQDWTLLWWSFVWYYALDCCHILLGKPWEYDRYAIHDGRLNQYNLWVNGKKQTLLPLTESLDEVICTKIKVSMANGN